MQPDNPQANASDASFQGKEKRSNSWQNFGQAIKHINDASISETVKQRFSDYMTILLVILCILALLAAVAIPLPTAFRLLPLGLTIAAVMFYIVNRLGI